MSGIMQQRAYPGFVACSQNINKRNLQRCAFLTQEQALHPDFVDFIFTRLCNHSYAACIFFFAFPGDSLPRTYPHICIILLLFSCKAAFWDRAQVIFFSFIFSLQLWGRLLFGHILRPFSLFIPLFFVHMDNAGISGSWE